MLDSKSRSRLGMALAQRTIETIKESGARVVVLAADEIVTDWSQHLGFESLRQTGPGLNAAASELVDVASGPWAIVFADLPLLGPADVAALIDSMNRGQVIAPARDGGTNAIGGHQGAIEFTYGPGSFHRHLAALRRMGPTEVLARTGLALDLDTPQDLRHAQGGSDWVRAALAAF